MAGGVQLVPENEQFSLNELQSFFLLLCQYCKNIWNLSRNDIELARGSFTLSDIKQARKLQKISFSCLIVGTENIEEANFCN